MHLMCLPGIPFVIEMVGRRKIGHAIALNSMMFNGARLIGPSVAGVMLTVTGEGICFLVNALSYLFCDCLPALNACIQ